MSSAEQDHGKLDAKFAGGLAWTAGAKWATQALTWVSTVAVARLLFPADVGVAEIAGIYFGLTNVLAEFGVGTAVLHMPELNAKTLRQLNAFSCLLCLAIFTVSVIAAPLLALFFRSDHVLYFAANNFAFLITGIQAVPFGLLQRDMDYRKLSLVEALMAFVQAVVTVLTAWLGWKYWALSAGGTAARLAGAVLLCYWKPVSFAWPRWLDIRKPVEMGRHVAISRVTSAAAGMADSIVVGRVLGEQALGSYRMALNLASAPADKVSMLIMRTATPLFARVMDDMPLVRRYYLIIAELLSLIVVPVMVGFVMVAPQAVGLLLGPKWVGATVPLQWLGLFMSLKVLSSLAEQVLVSQRLTQFTMRVSIINFAVMLIAFVLGAKWFGLTGVAGAWIALSPVTILPILIVVLRRIDLPFHKYATALLPAFGGAAVMCAALFLLDRQFLTPQNLPLGVRLPVQVTVGAIVYIAFNLAFFRAQIQRYVTFLRNLRKSDQQEILTEV